MFSFKNIRNVLVSLLILEIVVNFSEFFNSIDASPASNWQIGFQNPASAIAKGIIVFHDDLMVFLTLILFFVVYVLFTCVKLFSAKQDKKAYSERLTHATTIEIIWTVIPAVVLIIIAIPSFALIYSIDEMLNPYHTFKVIGHQWYWSYEFLSQDSIQNHLRTSEVTPAEGFSTTSTFDSYMLSEEEVIEYNKTEEGKAFPKYRLLSVDNALNLPVEKVLRTLVTSTDVLHSWAVPRLGVKIDACPGRLNQVNFLINYVGVYYGQCSEICGVNHGFMPIVINGYNIFSSAEFSNLDSNNLFDLESFVVSLQSE